jgi:hypothetical protein
LGFLPLVRQLGGALSVMRAIDQVERSAQHGPDRPQDQAHESDQDPSFPSSDSNHIQDREQYIATHRKVKQLP